MGFFLGFYIKVHARHITFQLQSLMFPSSFVGSFPQCPLPFANVEGECKLWFVFVSWYDLALPLCTDRLKYHHFIVMVDVIMEVLMPFLTCLMNYQERKKLGQLIKELRVESGLSQRAFASQYLDCSYAALRSWEEGESVPGIENLEQIAKLRGWSITQILDYVRGNESKPAIEVLLEQANHLTDEERLELARSLLGSVSLPSKN